MTNERILAEMAAKDARIRDLEAALFGQQQDIAVVFRLSPTPARLLALLMRVPVATKEMIQDRLGITQYRVTKSRLARELKQFEHLIGKDPIKGKRTIGYWIDDETKQKIKEVITRGVTSEDEFKKAETKVEVATETTPESSPEGAGTVTSLPTRVVA